ncbi:Methyltransferase domain-containing protein [Desulfonatronum thiosulfatophilum]|uniref:Methyltransferase domain-containing protein n=2 Tax=Desulfonatronum thiosulfatophilum TaxID=617002 RepID=A0A1G6DV04_9BACT|nr:Methyltransferase domain-containing protein [Desulfonatronum thiosulfatophilum]
MKECPVCNICDPVIVYTREGYPLIEGVNRIGCNFAFGFNDLNISLCNSCGHIYNCTMPGRSFLEREYFQWYPSPPVPGGMTTLLDTLIRRIVIYAQGNSGHSSSLFQDMCGDGYLLKHMREVGFSVAGTELDAYQLRFSNVEPEEEEIIQECFLEADIGRTFDYFVSYHVFEHVASTRDYLEKIRRVLNEDGVAVLQFPCLKTRMQKHYVDQFINAHASYFTVEFAVQFIESCGFDVQHYELNSNGSATVFARRSETYKALHSHFIDNMRIIKDYIYIEDHVNFLRTEFFGGIDPDVRIAFFGVGGALIHLLYTQPNLLSNRHCFIDNSLVKQGERICWSDEIIRPKSALSVFSPDLTVVTTTFAKEVVEYCKMDGKKVAILLPEPRYLDL